MANRSGIHINPAHKGDLHRDTHTPAGQKIPASKLEAAKHSSDPAVRRRATFAENAKHWDHHGSEHAKAVAKHIPGEHEGHTE